MIFRTPPRRHHRTERYRMPPRPMSRPVATSLLSGLSRREPHPVPYRLARIEHNPVSLHQPTQNLRQRFCCQCGFFSRTRELRRESGILRVDGGLAALVPHKHERDFPADMRVSPKGASFWWPSLRAPSSPRRQRSWDCSLGISALTPPWQLRDRPKKQRSGPCLEHFRS
jgi:hypothetical protein